MSGSPRKSPRPLTWVFRENRPEPAYRGRCPAKSQASRRLRSPRVLRRRDRAVRPRRRLRALPPVAPPGRGSMGAGLAGKESHEPGNRPYRQSYRSRPLPQTTRQAAAGAPGGPAEAPPGALDRGRGRAPPAAGRVTRPGATSCPSPWPTPGPPSCSRASATLTSTPSTSSCRGASDATETSGARRTHPTPGSWENPT